MSSAPLNQQQFDPGITQSYTGDLRRIVNRDGSFNVRRKGWSLKDLHVYQLLLSLSWPAFMGLVLALFIFINGIFAGLMPPPASATWPARRPRHASKPC